VPEWLDSQGLCGLFIYLHFPKESKRCLSVPTTQFLIQCFLQCNICETPLDIGFPTFVILTTGLETPIASKDGEIALSVHDICFVGDNLLSRKKSPLKLDQY
jgi:hypothetical protein